MELVFNGIRLLAPETVYEPSEESKMLATAASDHTKRSKPLGGISVLEMGCGCGIASLAAAKAGAKEVLGVDISPEAVRCANDNAKRNKIKNARFIESDLFESIPKNKRFDIILFNPPYLPTRYKDKMNGPLDYAFDGGKDGRRLLDVFLPQFGKYLNPSGSLLLVQSDLNGPIKTKRKLKELGYKVDVALREAFPLEVVYIYRAMGR